VSEKVRRYTLDEIFTYQVREDVIREFCEDHLEFEHDTEVCEALRVVLDYITPPKPLED